MSRVNIMVDKSRYLIVEKSVLPQVFLKVMEAKRLIDIEGLSVSEAVALVGISRSAFYKYRDKIFPPGETSEGRTIIIALNLAHVAGLLSEVLNAVAEFGANILTINQTIPINGMANVTISVETEGSEDDIDGLIDRIKSEKGVLSVKIIARE